MTERVAPIVFGAADSSIVVVPLDPVVSLIINHAAGLLMLHVLLHVMVISDVSPISERVIAGVISPAGIVISGPVTDSNGASSSSLQAVTKEIASRIGSTNFL